MRFELSVPDIEHYRTQGFVAIKGLLNEAELARFRDVMERAVALRGERVFPHCENKGPEGYFQNIFIQRINLWQDNDEVRELLLSPELGKLAADLAGVDRIRLWHDQVFIKKPWANPTCWHTDAPYWSFDHPEGMTMWIALDDTSPINGSLYFMPGSHRHTTFDIPELGSTDDIGLLFKKDYPGWESTVPVHYSLSAGDATVHNGLLMHAAGANMTPYPRRAVALSFVPDGAKFNGKKNCLSDAYLATLKVGDVLSGDEVPLVFDREHYLRQGG